MILRATHVLLVRVRDSTPGPWQAASPRFEDRGVEVSFELVRVLKESVPERPGGVVRVRVRQWRPTGSRFSAVPGVWSAHALDPGAEFVVFSRGPRDAADALAEPCCELVRPAGPILADVEAVAAAGDPPEALGRLLDSLADRLPTLGPQFALYVLDRLAEVLFEDPDGYDTVNRVAETPKLSPPTRHVLSTGIITQVLMRDPAPNEFVARLVVGSCRVLALPSEGSLQQNLLGTYLPNLLGLEGGATKKAARDVFAEHPDERKFVVGVLRNYPDQAAARPLREWAEAAG
jgi:hypothetical protein